MGVPVVGEDTVVGGAKAMLSMLMELWLLAMAAAKFLRRVKSAGYALFGGEPMGGTGGGGSGAVVGGGCDVGGKKGGEKGAVAAGGCGGGMGKEAADGSKLRFESIPAAFMAANEVKKGDNAGEAVEDAGNCGWRLL